MAKPFLEGAVPESTGSGAVQDWVHRYRNEPTFNAAVQHLIQAKDAETVVAILELLSGSTGSGERRSGKDQRVRPGTFLGDRPVRSGTDRRGAVPEGEPEPFDCPNCGPTFMGHVCEPNETPEPTRRSVGAREYVVGHEPSDRERVEWFTQGGIERRQEGGEQWVEWEVQPGIVLSTIKRHIDEPDPGGIQGNKDDQSCLMRLRAALAASPPGDAPIDVVAAIRRKGDLWWVCRRDASGAHGGLAGMWEYPGGKMEPGEQLREALVREMHEEFGGIGEVTVGRVLDSIEATLHGTGVDESGLADRVYRVTFFEVEFENEPDELRNHTEVRWATADEVCAMEHLPSGTIFNARHLTATASLPGGDARERIAEAVYGWHNGNPEYFLWDAASEKDRDTHLAIADAVIEALSTPQGDTDEPE